MSEIEKKDAMREDSFEFGKQIKAEHILVVIFLGLLSFHFIWSLGFEGLASPIYGGDHYFSMGCVEHVKNGGNPLASCHLQGQPSHYYPIYPVLIAGLSEFSGLSTISSMWLGSVLFNFMALVVCYFLFRRYSSNPWLCAAYSILFVTVPRKIFKGTQMEYAIFFPLFLLCLTYFHEKPNWKRAIMLGLVGGLNGLAISFSFPLLGLLFACMCVWYAARVFKKQMRLSHLGMLVVAGVITLCITLIMWGPLLPKLDERSELWLMGADEASTPEGAKYVFWTTLKGIFFDFENPVKIVRTIGFYAAILLLFSSMKYSEHRKLSWVLVGSSVITTFSYIPARLIDMNLFPRYLAISLWLSMLLLGIMHIERLIKMIPKFSAYVFVGVFLVALVSSNSFTPDAELGAWESAAHQSLPQQLVEADKFLDKANVGLNEVILTTKEIGFALNSVSGRKVVANRQAHNSPFTDTNMRELEAALMIYGNDDEVRLALLKKYNVSYLYWDTYWIQSEWMVSQDGKITDAYDPMFVIDTEASRGMMAEYNISYFAATTVPDPAGRSCERCAKWPLLFVLPSRMNGYTPWNGGLDKYLEAEWAYPSAEKPEAVLYRIKYE